MRDYEAQGRSNRYYGSQEPQHTRPVKGRAGGPLSSRYENTYRYGDPGAAGRGYDRDDYWDDSDISSIAPITRSLTYGSGSSESRRDMEPYMTDRRRGAMEVSGRNDRRTLEVYGGDFDDFTDIDEYRRPSRNRGSAQSGSLQPAKRKKSGLFASRYGNTYSYTTSGGKKRKVKTGKRIGAMLMTLLVAAMAFLAVYVFFSSMGIKELRQHEVYDDIGRYYEELNAYNPDGGTEKTVIVSDEQDYEPVSGADLSGTDVSGADMGSRKGHIVSSADMYVREPGGTVSKSNLAFKLGLYRMYSAMHKVELYANVQAGTESVDPKIFAKQPKDDICFVTEPTRTQLDTEGCYIMQVDRGGDISNVVLIVSDTVAPEVSYCDLELWLGESAAAKDFVVSVTDVSPVTVNFTGGEPDLTVPGTQELEIVTTDVYGNRGVEKTVRLTITEDVEPPVISGAAAQAVIIGEPVSYKNAITVADNRDTPDNITITVDSSEVKPKEKGTYVVRYTATDRAGNSSNYEVKFTFKTDEEKAKEEKLAVYVNKVAKSIFKDGMTNTQKLRAIYNWCHRNLRYSGWSVKDNWLDGALRGFKDRSGDCFTYFSCAKALLNYCGFDNIDVKKNRKPSQSRHYWSLVNVGTGWYHFDTCIRHNTFNGFMRTDAQLEAYSKKNDGSHRIDRSLYPATPKKAYK